MHPELPGLARTSRRFSMICDNVIHITGGAFPFTRRTLLTSESLIQIQTAFAGNGRGEDCEQVRATRVAEQRERQQGVASVWRRGVGRHVRPSPYFFT